MRTQKKNRTFYQELRTRHMYSIRSGLYSFFFQNSLKLLLLIAGIVGLLYLLEYLFGLKDIINDFIFTHHPILVYSVFFVSESILGWIPPDFFIVWAEQFSHPFLYVLLLATISYVGGINAYYLGVWLVRFPKLNDYILKKNETITKRIKKWGGAIVVFAALFPLPYAMTATVAGMVSYPVKRFLLFGLTRYIRFFVYASVIFKALENIL